MLFPICGGYGGKFVGNLCGTVRACLVDEWRFECDAHAELCEDEKSNGCWNDMKGSLMRGLLEIMLSLLFLLHVAICCGH